MSAEPQATASDYGGVDRSQRKRLGLFYTPEPLARIIAQWCLEDGVGPVLDPSFGGCSFLRASLSALRARDVPNAGSLVHGIDIDEVNARRHASILEGDGVPPVNFTYGDFLATQSDPRFAAVLGNPPYIRHQSFSEHSARKGSRLALDAGLTLSRRASAWAYFVVHSVGFVRPGGRMAFVLPGAVLEADYSAALRKFLCESFGWLALVRLDEQVFDAQEETVILLASSRGGMSDRISYLEVRDVDGLASMLAGPTLASGNASRPKEGVLEPATLETWERLAGASRPLSEIARIRIGVVTGANSFFVRNRDERVALVPTAPVVARGAWLETPIWESGDHKAHDMLNERAWLLALDGGSPEPEGFAQEISDLAATLGERSQAKRRPKWWALEDLAVPDAFLAYMGSAARRLVKNSGRSTCTNAIHRIWWKDEVDGDSVVLSSWTSLFRFGVEFRGRHYGGGVLKIEPGRAGSLPIVGNVPDAKALLKKLDALARRAGNQAAHDLADQIVLRDFLKASEAEITALRSGTASLSARRQRDRQGATLNS